MKTLYALFAVIFLLILAVAVLIFAIYRIFKDAAKGVRNLNYFEYHPFDIIDEFSDFNAYLARIRVIDYIYLDSNMIDEHVKDRKGIHFLYERLNFLDLQLSKEKDFKANVITVVTSVFLSQMVQEISSELSKIVEMVKEISSELPTVDESVQEISSELSTVVESEVLKSYSFNIAICSLLIIFVCHVAMYFSEYKEINKGRAFKRYMCQYERELLVRKISSFSSDSRNNDENGHKLGDDRKSYFRTKMAAMESLIDYNKKFKHKKKKEIEKAIKQTIEWDTEALDHMEISPCEVYIKGKLYYFPIEKGKEDTTRLYVSKERDLFDLFIRIGVIESYRYTGKDVRL